MSYTCAKILGIITHVKMFAEFVFVNHSQVNACMFKILQTTFSVVACL